MQCYWVRYNLSFYHHHDHEFLNPPGSRGRCIDGRCTSCLHLWRSWARAWVVAKLFPVHSAMLSVHFFLCLPLLRPPSTVFSMGNWLLSRDHTIAVFFSSQCRQQTEGLGWAGRQCWLCHGVLQEHLSLCVQRRCWTRSVGGGSPGGPLLYDLTWLMPLDS